ncbi:glutathione S-transferase [Crepidotus variabilis]|uniref:glutathione transferase n=1 Tax=Crepidotus variabilis TaxID=179855 RepID=A0A9P6JW07_9AGAR|nr:glutathione S-transferase [Crepidotus variabilis]
MVLKLYGSSIATCTRRVALILHEKKVPFELHEIDVRGGAHKKTDYLEKQPFGQIPYIDHDGFILYESRAICYYIASIYSSQGTKDLLPSDPKANARLQQALSVEVANFNAFAEKAVVEKYLRPMYSRDYKPDEKICSEAISTLDAKLDAYEKILSKQKYLAGDELTLADLYHLVYGSLLPNAGYTGLESESRPNVARWFKELSSRPAWQAVKENGFKSVAAY